jgi:CRISPR-associated protein Cas2
VTVIVLIAAAPGLRGHLTRWMVEVAPGVFVGNPNARIRDKVWATLIQRIGNGQAVMVRRTGNEQRWTALTAGTDRWTPVDFDGLTLVRRPAAPSKTIPFTPSQRRPA